MARKVASPLRDAAATAVSEQASSSPSTGASGASLDEVVGAIGPKLRELRQANGLSLQQLAALAQVSAAAIHKVERGDMVPTITTMLKLSAALHRPVGYFIDELAEPFEVAAHVAAGDRPQVETTVAGLALERISGPAARFRMQAQLATIDPGAESEDAVPQTGGEALMVVLDGAIDVALQGRDYSLAPGDALHFPTDRTHRWANSGDQPAHVLLVRLSDR
jgi:transcriptional regulator with XRE-family HTH domain